MNHTRFRTLISCFAAACMLSPPLMFGSGCKRTTSERDISFLTPEMSSLQLQMLAALMDERAIELVEFE